MIVGPEEESAAEDAIQANYGLGRRIYEAPVDRSSIDIVYVEVTPAGTEPPPEGA